MPEARRSNNASEQPGPGPGSRIPAIRPQHSIHALCETARVNRGEPTSETTSTYRHPSPPRLGGTLARFLLWNLVGFPAWFPMLVLGHPGLGAIAGFVVVGGGSWWLWLTLHTVDAVRLGATTIAVKRRGAWTEIPLESAWARPSKLTVFTSGGGFMLRSETHTGLWFVARATDGYLELTARLAMSVRGGTAFSSAVFADRLERRKPDSDGQSSNQD